jgi:glycosyltransferase involved in cell wall biosynthesis
MNDLNRGKAGELSCFPKISVVTPSYNQGEFLERTICSVLDQGYPNLEYIVIDGGSTDGSLEIIKKYEKHLSYWVSEPDQGQGDAINKGFLKSTGQILAWINSDDVYLPGAFWKIAELFNKNSNAAIVYGDYIKVDSEDKCVALRRQPSFSYRICLYGYLTIMQPASFFGRQAFLDAGGVDIAYEYAMDYDLILRLAKGRRVVHTKEYLAAFRIHSSSKSVAKKSCFRDEDRSVRIKNIGHQPFPAEFLILHLYYKVLVLFRMLKEGCLPSRFGIDGEGYMLGRSIQNKVS